MLHDVTSYLIVQCVLKVSMANSCGSQDSMGREKSHQLFVDKGKRLDDGEECVPVDSALALETFVRRGQDDILLLK